MHRFAYPNVIPQQSEFIGCGRYLAIPADQAGMGDSAVKDGPETPDLSHLRRSIETLAPESYDSEKIIFERKDRPEKTYRGNSADLAFLLAHISRARSLVFPDTHYTGDIWCTGIVKFREQTQTAILSEVDSKGFRIKLDSFLAEENPDTLFIAPTANLDDAELENKITAQNARLLSLTQFRASDKHRADKRKTVVKVLSNEIPALIHLFFERLLPNRPDRKREKARRPFFIGIIAILALITCGWWLHSDLLPRLIINSIENGEFARTARLIKTPSMGNDPLVRLKEMLDAPVNMTIKLEYRHANEPSAPIFRQAFSETHQTVLNHTHDYRLLVAATALPAPLYLYAFQEDWRGKIDPLFPNPVWNPGQNNPIRAAEFPYYIPADANGWFYMDKLLSSSAMPTAPETVYVIASPWKAKDVEKAFGEINQQTDPVLRKMKLAQFVQRLKLRRNSGLKSFYFGVFSFQHGRSSDSR